MSNKQYTPQAHSTISILKDFKYSYVDHSYTYDEKTYRLLDEIFELLIKKIKPTGKSTDKRKIWTLWFKTERGPIEAFGDFEEMKSYGEVETYEEFENLWKMLYPDEEDWYCFDALYDEEINYRAIFMKNRQIIEYADEIEATAYPYNISEFTEWLLESLKECIDMLEKGTYNEYVRNNLPAKLRTGTILLKDYWDIIPEYRYAHQKEISNEEIEEYLENIKEQVENPDKKFTDKIPEMTANKFFEYCALGYKANNYDGCDLPPEKQYRRHADGRDGGLFDIDPDSPQAFRTWIEGNTYYGCHPWEVCRGGNSTHIDLYVNDYDDGYTLTIAGSSSGRSTEAVKFYNALKKKGLPVYIVHAEEIAARLKEEEKIGIVPEGIIPRYCESWFPDETIIDFMNLPYDEEDGKRIADKAVWQPIKEVELL